MMKVFPTKTYIYKPAEHLDRGIGMAAVSQSEKSKVSRRRFLTYAGAGVVVIAAAGAGAYYLTRPPPTTEVKIGVPIVSSGPFATYGLELKQGYDLALEQFNAGGGFKSLGGVKANFLYADVKGEVEAARSETERLILSEKVPVLMGGMDPSCSLVIGEVAEKYKVPYLSDSGMVEKLVTSGWRYTFKMVCNEDGYVLELVDLMDHLGLTKQKIALIHANDEWGTSMSQFMTKIAEQHGHDIVLDEPYDYATKDFTPIITKIKSVNPDILAPTSGFADAVLFTNQLAEQGVHIPMFSTGGGYTLDPYIEGTGKNSEHIITASMWQWDAKFPGNPEFVAAFKAKYNANPDQWHACSYALSQILFDSIERAGTVDPEQITNAIYNTNLATIYGQVEFNKTGPKPAMNKYRDTGGAYPAVVLQIQNGKLTTVWPSELAATQPIWPP